MTDGERMAGEDVDAPRKERPVALWIAMGLVIFMCASPCALLASIKYDKVREDIMIKPERYRATVEQNLERWFPGFRIISLKQYQSRPSGWNPSSDPISGFHFVLESSDVEGFRLDGQYLTYGHAAPEAQRELKENIFNGETLTRHQAVALQELWVETYPNAVVLVGAYARTSVFALEQLQGTGDQVSEQYTHVPHSQVYRLDGDTDEQEEGWRPGGFFRLDPQSGEWTHLPGYLIPSWELDE